MQLNRKLFLLTAYVFIALSVAFLGGQTVSAAPVEQASKISDASRPWDNAYQELLEASRLIEKVIQQSPYKVERDRPVLLIWPLSGEVTTAYGWSTHPIFGTQKYHSGMDIAGEYGVSIVAGDGGVVIYAGWISGYGNTVIIGHGRKIATLYAHNDSIAVEEGQKIIQGEKIASCGSTGYSTGPHCHFEVREDGAVVDPMLFYGH